MSAETRWSRRFDDVIVLPDGRELVTLRDAGEYIQALPKAKHERPEWQIAVEMLIAAVDGTGPLMFAEIAVRKAVHTGKRDPEPPPRRKAAKSYLGHKNIQHTVKYTELTLNRFKNLWD